jgi:hypothetical protein
LEIALRVIIGIFFASIPAAFIYVVYRAFVRQERRWRMEGIVVLVLVLLFREVTPYLFRRSLGHSSQLTDEQRELFWDGVVAVGEYCSITSLYVAVIGLLLIVLCMSGFKRPKSEDQLRELQHKHLSDDPQNPTTSQSPRHTQYADKR